MPRSIEQIAADLAGRRVPENVSYARCMLLEKEALGVIMLNRTVVPGTLHTRPVGEAYLGIYLPDAPPEDREVLMEARQQRAELPVPFTHFVDESVLDTPPVGMDQADWAAQLGSLAQPANSKAHVRLIEKGVFYPGPPDMTEMLYLPDGGRAVYLEAPGGGPRLLEGDDPRIPKIGEMFDHLGAIALDEPQSADRIREHQAEYLRPY